MAVLWVPITLLITLSYAAAGCPSGWLDCQNGECVALIWQCDGENDCGNNMDEMNCDRAKSKVCTDTEILCVKDESCIPKSWRCDGANDCIDNSDELNCENVDNCNGFRCRDNHCIPRSWKCDGTPDCPDNSDEDSCPSSAAKLCSESEFTCGSGSCLDVKKVCDGRKDCPDGSDEGDHCNDKCTNATCSQKCRSSPHGPECYCNDGYKLNASDKRTCSDIDECSEDGFCSQHCTNILGSYKCSCLDGYDLENNTCKASGPEPVLIFSTLEEIRAMYLRSKRYFPVHKAFVKTASVDADPLNSRVYWVEISNQSSIYSSDIDGSKLETILQTGLMVPEGIAVDYLGRNLYLTDSGLKQILVCKIDGSMCHVLHDTNIHSPRAISLDVYEGLVYWSDWGNQSVGIYRSGMDGSRRVALVSQDIKWPNGIAIDHSTNRLYWTDAFLGTIEYITLDGKTRKVLLKDDTFHPYSLAVFEDNLYWSDWNTFSLDSCNKFSGHKFGVMIREKKHIMGVHVYHPVLARHNRNPCWNHPCSHMCLLAPFNDFACACPFGFKLNADGRRCNIDNGSPMLWVNDETNIYHIRPQSVGSISVDELPIPHMESIGRMAYDWESKALYISDTKKPAIYSVNMTTLARRELVRNHLVMPGDLAYDWLNRNLYWVDSSKGTVEVVSTFTLRRVNVVVDLSKPTAIALLPSAGRMFISTTGDDQSVAMYDMDGKNRKLLIGSSSFVVALAVHPTLSHLYLVDPREEQISFVNYMSPVRNPSILQSRIGSVLSIAADERFVYWTESSKHVLNYAFQDKTFSYTVVLPGHKNGLVSRKVIYASEPPKNSLGHGNCEMNGGCAYLCLGSPNGRTCVCSLGMQLSQDGRTCTEKECTRDEFKCTGSKKCLPHEFVCDGVKDCDDGSDESCTGTGKLSRCPGDDFRCTNGRCIMSTWKCDHRDDCGDGSDEVGCPPPTGCGKDQYQCTDAECIPLLWRCDGENDCNDHSDETACNATSCNPEIQLRCDHGQCIPRSWACDGTNDCFDGTDERNCSSARACDAKQFKCDDGICIDKSLVCDQRSDCDDGSDEKNCTREKCIEGKRQCADGATCIYVHEICDQVKDCPHGDDEVNCTRKESDCLPDQYFCTNNSRCVPKGWLCDGDNDCGDAADENPDNCTRRVKPTLPPHTAFLDCEEFFCGWSGECIPWSKLCDGVNDCKDLTDEGGSCAVSCIEFGCSQVCQRTPQGPKCSCYPGFSLLADEVTCEDLNECSIPGSCSQFCSNTKGGFKCSCAEGYLLEQHSKCKADGGPATLAYLLSDQIRGIDLSTHAQRVYVRREGGTDMRGMDYDAEKGLFFFTDWKEGTIYSYNPNNNKLEALLTVLERPHYLRWDWIAKNLYFTNDEGSIIACTRDGKYCNTLVPEAADHVNGFDIAPRKGVMFWCVWGNGKNRNGIIERADMDGSRRTTIVRERLDWPNAVTVDHIMEMVYWVDARANVMECVNFHGLQRRVVVSDGAYYPYTMAMFEDFVYWSDWGTDIIIRCNKHTGRECKGLHGTNTKSEVFMVVHAVNQPKGDNKCHNSECSHLCLPTRTSFSCLCDRNYQMVNGVCVTKTTDVMPDTTTPKSFCVPDPCENGALCDEQEDTYICLCPDGYTGDRCDVQQAASTPPYDYSLVVGLVLAILSVVLIVLVAVYCRMKRDKLAQMGESVAVSFRKGVHRKGSRLIVDTDDDGGACERLVLDPHDQSFKKGFRNPLFGKKPKLVVDPESPQPDGDFKRWPSFDSADSAFASGEATREGSQLSVDASPLSGGSVDRLSHFFKR